MKRNFMLPVILAFLLNGLVINECGIDSASNKTNKKQSDEKDTNEQQHSKLKLYDVKSGIIEYDLGTSVAGKQTKTVYFDQWGHYQREESTSFLNGREIKVFTIMRGRNIYNVDFTRDKAVKATLARKHAGIDLKKIIKKYGSKEAALQELKKIGITLEEDQEFAGYPCQVIVTKLPSAVVKQWVYKGIPLKMVSTPLSKQLADVTMVEEATRIQFDAPIDVDKFELPAGIEILTGDELRRQAQNELRALKSKKQDGRAAGE